MITLITCTADRPEAFALCEKWIANQTYKGALCWIVVDSGRERVKTNLHQELYQGFQAESGNKSLNSNLLKALSVLGDSLYLRAPIFIIEDDDYYSPYYLEAGAELLRGFDFVAEDYTRLYHVSFRRYEEIKLQLIGGLFQTAFRAQHIPFLIDVISAIRDRSDLYADKAIWTALKYQGLSAGRFPIHLSLGIKGMPGRRGISGGHDALGWTADPNGEKLREWIGADADEYLNREYPNAQRWFNGDQEFCKLNNK